MRSDHQGSACPSHAVASAEIPDPSAGSWFRLDCDEQGQPRLSWRELFTWPVFILGNAMLLGFTAAFGFFVYKLAAPILLNLWNVVPQLLGRNVLIDVFLVIGLGLLTAGVVAMAFILVSMKSMAWHRPGPERLTFGQSALRYEFEGGLWFARRQVREMPRDEVGAVRLGSFTDYLGAPPRQRLTIDHGAEPVEIGKDLQEPDRQWLARMLRDWVGERKPPASAAVPELPQNALITVTRNDEWLTLRWKPTSAGFENPCGGRWVGILQLSVFVFFWSLLEVIIIAQVIAILMGRWQALGQIQWFVLAWMLLWLPGWTIGGLAMFRQSWVLLRRPEACLTLTSTFLQYRPAPHFDGSRFCTDSLRTIPRCDIRSIDLGHSESGQRLTVGHGVDRIEIGPGLREPEREWLAGVLQAWAPDTRPEASGAVGAISKSR